MYVNFNVLDSKNISWEELMILQIIYQKDYSRLEKYRDGLNSLWKKEMLTLIKEVKKDTPKYMLARLSDKGKRFLKDLSVAEITDESRNLAAKLISLYDNNNLTIANKKKIVELVSWFLAETGFEPNKVYAVVQTYISETPKEFTSNLNNLIWRGESVFATKWQLSQSKLYGLMTK